MNTWTHEAISEWVNGFNAQLHKWFNCMFVPSQFSRVCGVSCFPSFPVILSFAFLWFPVLSTFAFLCFPVLSFFAFCAVLCFPPQFFLDPWRFPNLESAKIANKIEYLLIWGSRVIRPAPGQPQAFPRTHPAWTPPRVANVEGQGRSWQRQQCSSDEA